MPSAQEVFGGGLAVVTGAGEGIGAGAVRHLVGDLGMTVVAADSDETAVHRLAAALGERVVPRVVDVRDADAVDRLACQVEEELGPVRLLLTGAQVEQSSYLWDVPTLDWQRVVDVGISAAFHGIRAFLPSMISSGQHAHVLALAPTGAVTAVPRRGPCTLSTHAVLAMVECLHQEIAEVGADVAVSAVLPGPVASGDPREAADPSAMSADDAARTVVAQAARGEFYIATHPEVHEALAARAGQLANRRAPITAQHAGLPG